MEEKILKKIKMILAKKLGEAANEITIESSFKNIGIDSLDAVALIADLEDEFDIEVINDEILSVTNLKDVIVLVTSKLNA